MAPPPSMPRGALFQGAVQASLFGILVMLTLAGEPLARSGLAIRIGGVAAVFACVACPIALGAWIDARRRGVAALPLPVLPRLASIAGIAVVLTALAAIVWGLGVVELALVAGLLAVPIAAICVERAGVPVVELARALEARARGRRWRSVTVIDVREQTADIRTEDGAAWSVLAEVPVVVGTGWGLVSGMPRRPPSYRDPSRARLVAFESEAERAARLDGIRTSAMEVVAASMWLLVGLAPFLGR